ncbi:winged helix-turn-helix transcriptional regulator [Maritimibacter sp. DP07]|uniref:Winged helix-turn-helix transcriptional regulator n=1 Tax=Maritimibacter harenae TaxID=2606218 RepID=A0A845M5I4_9RHOB|nr:Lrp/AsnC family transcriptional regulator [Maritimibacter harenae]MZR13688.1 winged helix-turn-helix transcriptional regulator [Maritimibacter harenae]
MTSRPLDRLDSRILAILSEDGRISNANLAQAVGLSPSPCWQRVRRLEEEGVISGYRAIVDRAKLGSSEIVMIEVILDRHDDEVLENFGRAMQEMPEVLEVMLTTGEYDYLIKVAVSGTRAYEEFLRSKLYRVPGIRHSRSSFVLRSLKERQYDPSLQAG